MNLNDRERRFIFNLIRFAKEKLESDPTYQFTAQLGFGMQTFGEVAQGICGKMEADTDRPATFRYSSTPRPGWKEIWVHPGDFTRRILAGDFVIEPMEDK